MAVTVVSDFSSPTRMNDRSVLLCGSSLSRSSATRSSVEENLAPTYLATSSPFGIGLPTRPVVHPAANTTLATRTATLGSHFLIVSSPLGVMSAWAVGETSMSRSVDPRVHPLPGDQVSSLVVVRARAARAKPAWTHKQVDDEVDPCPRTALSPAMSLVPGT